MRSALKLFVWLTIFSIAMGYLETAVVVYLRKIYYPGGFNFPLVPIEPSLAVTEFWREAATIIMLGVMGYLAGKNRAQRWAFFVYCFAIWDIFYYIFLKLLLNWPESLFTWDILFLIPVPWIGPVLAPCIVSLTMIVFCIVVVYYDEISRPLKFSVSQVMLFVFGCLIIIVSFMWDYIEYLSVAEHPHKVWTLSNNEDMFSEIVNYIPAHYNWGMFVVGELMLLGSLFISIKKQPLKIYAHE
jgi:hypothetical protein